MGTQRLPEDRQGQAGTGREAPLDPFPCLAARSHGQVAESTLSIVSARNPFRSVSVINVRDHLENERLCIVGIVRIDDA